MAGTIEQLTPEQEKELEVWRDRWLGIGLSTERANRPRAEAAISEMYRVIGLKPPTFVWCESPKKCLETLSLLGSFDAAMEKGTKPLLKILGVKTEDLADDIPMPDLLACLQEKKDGLKKLAHKPEREYLGKEWWGQHEAYWIATYLFCREVLSVAYGEEKNKYIDLWAEVCQSCCWWWPFEETCVISERPTACHLNADGRLHCENGPALAFNDENCQLYSLNGVIVSKWLVETPAEQIDPTEVAKEKNAEVRREIVRKIGVERVCHKLGAKVIHKIDEATLKKYLKHYPKKIVDALREYELLELKIDGHNWKYLKMHNPSVPEVWHVEGVDNSVNTVEEALHWRKPQAMQKVPIDDVNGEEWPLQGDVHMWPRNAKKLKRFPNQMT